MRRYYVDELPQLVNVFMGEMSLVGPRPERPYFIERIREQAPEIDQILQVKPGVIGWSQLAYGYADSVSQMLDRMRYDQLYVQHQSWVLDLKIALLSLKRIALGKGR
jgi:lipopolysaccharide/colanic/teichoic acid biosynthesis glycosyltransferase